MNKKGANEKEMNEKERCEKRRRSKKTNIDEKTGTMSGMRRIMKTSQGVHFVCIPKEFLERHNLKAGDPLPFVSNHVLKFVPVKEIE